MADLLARLIHGPCVLLDGGLGSMLLDRGMDRGDAPERLNMSRPELLLEVHRAYVEAGSEAVQTNTFGGTRSRLRHFGLEEHGGAIQRRAVEIAREAGPAFVLGDMGPTGEYLPPVGKGDLALWGEDFRVQATALLEAGVDGIHLETMSDLREALAGLEAVRSLSTTLPVLVSLTFDRKQRGFFTVMGDPLVPSLQRLVEEGATAVGANCTLDSRNMAALALEALGAGCGPLVVQANAGQPRTEGVRVHYDQSPRDFVADLRPVIAEGIAAIGGCCGTDPRFVAELARALGRG